MRRFLTILAVLPCLLTPAVAQDSSEETALTTLMTYYDARGWEGVGRLNIGNTGMCTGALISANQVLTAAHCLYNPRTGQRVDPGKIRFLAGFRNGRASAWRDVRRAAVHPDYDFTANRDELRVENDVALLELESPIVLHNIQPFQIAARPRKGASVGVVSYAHDRADTPSLQKVCHVLARQRGSLVLSCEVDFGSSGAPIFVEENGQPRIVSVVSAKATVRGRQVSLGTSLEEPLSELKRMMASGAGLTSSPPQTASRNLRVGDGGALNRGGALNGGGITFAKP